MTRRAAALSSLLLLRVITLSVVHAQQQQQKQTSLDGYAFYCVSGQDDAGVSIGFEGNRNVHCMNDSKGIPCGHYQYNGEELTGFSTLTGSFQSNHVQSNNGVVVAFDTSTDSIQCHCVSLDWTRYSHETFLGMSCPQNDHNVKRHFSFGLTGDVALRETITTMKEKENNDANPKNEADVASDGTSTITRDYYGVFQYYGDENEVRMHFGPQQDKSTAWTMEGVFQNGELVLTSQDGGPCVHDGASRIDSSQVLVDNLSPAATFSTDNIGMPDKDSEEQRATWDSTVIAVGHASATTVAALGASVTLQRSKPAYGLTVGWGLAAVADKVEQHLSRKRRSLSKTLKKGVMIQRMLCWGGSVVCVAAAATTSVCSSSNMLVNKLMALFLAKRQAFLKEER